MSKVKRLVAGGLLVASDVVAAHQDGFPHHFLSEPNAEHYWLIGSGLEYVFACVVATVVFFVVRRVAVKKK
ncbi:hypothetical protein [Thiothrix lacustris]|uniref:Uncharacterized protein n=1 Tax=Thiothrix lacustris TaxID=525917 RepID=A0ABY9MMQ2_9GAMM|nr:hypothetical protein [Thiothrix lacustris]WML89935.1 hypothetical protein RCF98_13265 [Thiothrix lacustris]WMP18459.1 hypothetical protein RCS87_05215 [Thiothrix lacustris]